MLLAVEAPPIAEPAAPTPVVLPDATPDDEPVALLEPVVLLKAKPDDGPVPAAVASDDNDDPIPLN